MTSKLTRERIEWLNYAATGLAANGTEMTMSPQDVIALTECCLAAMDSDPVVFTDERNLHHIVMGRETSLIWGKQNSEAGDVPLYRHAQPAPECQHQWKFGGANKLQSQKQCIKCGRVELDAQQPIVPDERAAFNAWNNDVDCPLAGRDAKSAAWMAWQARAMLKAGTLTNEDTKKAGNSPVNDVTAGKPFTILLPDISSKAFWSGAGKNETFHPETYRRWVKEAIERYCAIARIDVEVK